MGIFDKLKSIISKKEKVEVKEQQEEIKLYDKGLEKTRLEFVSKLNMLGIKYNISKNKNIAGSILSTISIMLEKESKYLNILIQSLTC